jgi:hypothetical protein
MIRYLKDDIIDLTRPSKSSTGGGGGGYGGTVVISSCLSPVFRNDEHPVWTKSVFRGFWHRKKKLVKSWDK